MADMKAAAAKRDRLQKQRGGGAPPGRTELEPGITVTPPQIYPETGFAPMDMRGPRPVGPPQRFGPPNPNEELVPEGALPGWILEAALMKRLGGGGGGLA